MLSQSMVDALNRQINLEMQSAHLYLQMSSWCAHQALDGCANFLSQHADEEMMICDACSPI
jgi:ferritin